jgi:co-chaperonin GroES (HSP10)
MLQVVGHRVLIKPEPLEKKSTGGIIISYGDAEKRYEAATEKGTVVAVGEMAWRNEALGYGLSEWKPWAAPGDQVIFAKYSGKFVQDPNSEEKFIVVNDVDIQVVIKESNNV